MENIRNAQISKNALKLHLDGKRTLNNEFTDSRICFFFGQCRIAWRRQKWPTWRRRRSQCYSPAHWKTKTLCGSTANRCCLATNNCALMVFVHVQGVRCTSRNWSASASSVRSDAHGADSHPSISCRKSRVEHWEEQSDEKCSIQVMVIQVMVRERWFKTSKTK